MHDVLFDLTVTFALVTGTVAGVLALLTWEILRRTPFGRAVFVLSVALVLFAAYHALLLVVHTEPVLAGLFRSGVFTAMALFIGLLVHFQRTLDGEASG